MIYATIEKVMISSKKSVFSIFFLSTFLGVVVFLLSYGSSVFAQSEKSAQIQFPTIQKHLREIQFQKFKPACSIGGINTAHCLAKITTHDDGITLLVGSTPSPSSLGPVQLHTA